MPAKGTRIREQRKQLKMTQAELAKTIGVSKVAVSNWENDVYSPEGENLDNLLKLFDVSADYLLGKTDTPRNASPAFAVMLREFLDDTPGALEEISKQTGIPVSDIELYASGTEEPSGGRVRVITQAMGAMGWRPRLKYKEPQEKSNVSKTKTITVPVTSMEIVASCGVGAGLYGVEAMPDEVVYIEPSDIQRYDDLRPPFGIRIRGDSMEGAGLDEGSIAVINPADDVNSGDMALVVWNDNWFIKWVVWFPDGSVELRSANPAYAPIKIEKEFASQKEWFLIKGKVVSMIRKDKPPRAF